MPGTFLAARAADLGTDLPHMLNLKANEPKRQPLKEHSLSDLNRVNSRPTVRIVDKNAIPSPDKVYEKSPFPRLPSQVLKPTNGAENLEPTSPAISAEYTLDSRPSTRDGQPAVPSPLHLNTGHRHRTSISTTTSNADTLVANSVFSPTTAVFSPTSQRYSLDSTHKTPIGALEPLEELPVERSSQFEPEQELDDENKQALGGRLPPPLPPRTTPTSHGYTVAPIGGPMDSSFIMPSQSGELDDGESTSADESRPATSHQIRYVSSSESIRPQFASIRPSAAPAPRPEQELWLQEHSVPALSVGRKRMHRKSASLTSFPSQSRMIGASPHLATIASESDVNYARLVYDSPALGGLMWPRKRRTTVASSAYSESLASPKIPDAFQTSSSYDSIPTFSRENSSAIPEPLFSSSVRLPQEPFQQPGHAHNTSELDDTIGELQPPAHTLRQKRSGYIIKSRSQTEFKSTYSLGGERWTDSLFPAWAKKFYGGKAYLLSNNASRITLGGSRLGGGAGNESCVSLPASQTASRPASRPPTRGKFWRHATVDSFAPSNVSPGTRPGSGLSNWETIYSRSSPPSSRLPSILRPKRSRTHVRTGLNVMTASRDSVEISELPGDVPPVPPVSESWSRKLRAKRSFRNPLRSHPTIGAEPEDEDAANPAADEGQIVRQIEWRTRSHTIGTLPTEPSLTAMPHLVQNERLAKNGHMFRVPSFDEPLKDKWLGPCNRQILAFCLGFIFPPLWIIASFLTLPYRPSAAFSVEVDSVLDLDEKGRHKTENDTEAAATWSWDQERTFLKAKWWQTLNRVMSVVGLGIMALIIALAVLAAS